MLPSFELLAEARSRDPSVVREKLPTFAKKTHLVFGFVRVTLTLPHCRSCPEVEIRLGSRIRHKGKNRVLLCDKSKHSVMRPETFASEGAQNRNGASNILATGVPQRSNNSSVFTADFNSRVTVSVL